MKKTTITFAAVVASAFGLVSCGVDGFADESAKLEAYNLVKCDAYMRIDPTSELRALQSEAFSGADKEEALTAIMQMAGATTMGEVVPRTGDTEYFGEDVMCDGWVWDWYKSRPGYMDGYEDFSYGEFERHVAALEGN